MAQHTEGNGRNGRNVALPDENRPSWRPQDETQRARRSMSEEDDRYDDDRYGRHWEDRSHRDWDRNDRYGQGQSGYGAGRYEGDRSFEQRNQGYPGSFEERYRDRGTDDRFGGRGGSAYYERDRGGYSGPRGYGYGDGDRQFDRQSDRQNLGTGGAIHSGSTSREIWTGREGSTGYSSGATSHRGKGPSSYQRSDERLREMICEALTDDDRVDASNIEVSVKSGEVTLTGHVADRQQKRAAEDCVENVPGVKDVQNQIRTTR